MCNLGKYFNCFSSAVVAKMSLSFATPTCPHATPAGRQAGSQILWPHLAQCMIKFYRLEIFQFSKGASASLTTHARTHGSPQMLSEGERERLQCCIPRQIYKRHGVDTGRAMMPLIKDNNPQQDKQVGRTLVLKRDMFHLKNNNFIQFLIICYQKWQIKKL